MNSSRKKSINQTPFKLMWGRESRYQDLLSHVNNKNQFGEDSDDDTQLEEMDGHQVIDEHDPMIEIFDPPELPNETFNLLKEYRESLWENGVESILSEQLKQKRQFEKKVSDKR